MYDRTIDRMSDGASEFLVQFYLQSPKLSVTVLLAAWLLLFFTALWYFVLLPATSNNLVNGSFEARLVGWGTGWLEDFPTYRGAARLNQYLATRSSQTGQLAVADWRSDPTEHRPGGRFALLIEHRSDKQTEVYSTLAQRIRVKPRTGYHVRFWAKVDRMDHDGDLWLSPSGSSVAWDEPKIEVSGAGKGWQFYRLDFNSGDRTDLDIRLVAEGPLKVWVDDVVVSRVPAGETWIEKVGSWLGSLWAILR
jgi:hypothetical protein